MPLGLPHGRFGGRPPCRPQRSPPSALGSCAWPTVVLLVAVSPPLPHRARVILAMVPLRAGPNGPLRLGEGAAASCCSPFDDARPWRGLAGEGPEARGLQRSGPIWASVGLCLGRRRSGLGSRRLGGWRPDLLPPAAVWPGCATQACGGCLVDGNKAPCSAGHAYCQGLRWA
jgi:hypothetical protein